MERNSEPHPLRVFIVGCPRSGTTFLQDSLARHPQIMSLPETAFFEHVVGGLDEWIAGEPMQIPTRRFGRTPRRVHREARRILAEMADTLCLPAPGRQWNLEGYVRSFTQMLDTATLQCGRRVWIEKSPVHVAYVDLITRLIPDAHFIHILRNGEDVMASIVDAEIRFHTLKEANGFNRWLPAWAGYWNRAMEMHLQCSGRSAHCFLTQESLSTNYSAEEARLLDFLSLPPRSATEAMIATPVSDARREPWKASALSGKAMRSRRKFEALFGPEMQQWFRSQLMSYDSICKRLQQAGRLPADARVVTDPMAFNTGARLYRSERIGRLG